MKRIEHFALAVLLLAALPAWSAKKITVAELKDMLTNFHQQNRSDADVSNALKQVQLSEQLTRSTMNSLVPVVPGQLSTEQIYVLEARSAMLVPPASDIPATPEPDEAAKQALITKANDYARKIYMQLPAISLTRTTLRFQDNVETLAANSGLHAGATDAPTGLAVNAYQFVHYINATDTVIALERGEQELPEDKTKWGGNGMISLMQGDPNLAQVLAEALDGGVVKWVRWELVNGKPAAGFSFSVPKKKTHLAMNVCCFPKIEQAGTIRSSSVSGLGGGNLGGSQGGAGGSAGNVQSNTEYSPYKSIPPYHGEIFIDPETGTVVRLIVQADFKSSDVVHQLDTRVDYGPVMVGDKALVLPMKTIINTEVVPYGESGGGSYHPRCTLFTSEYKNQRLKGDTARK